MPNLRGAWAALKADIDADTMRKIDALERRYMDLAQRLEQVAAENKRLRELCHQALCALLSAGDALNWPDDIEDAIAELRKTVGR